MPSEERSATAADPPQTTPKGRSTGVTRPGAVTFAAGLAGFGLLYLVTGDAELFWKLYPGWTRWRAAFACGTGLMLLAGGLAMLVPRSAKLGTLVATLTVLLWLVVFGVPRAIAHPANELVWLKFGQNLVLVTGGWTLLRSLAKRDRRTAALSVPDVAVGRRPVLALYGIALPMIGLSHFVYVKAAVAAVPSWLPFRVGLAYLTGAGHIAAGLGILFGVFSRLAATAEAAMLTLFLFLVSVPDLVGKPATRVLWMHLFVTATDAGAAWIVAGSLRGEAWGLGRRTAGRAEGSRESA